MCVGNNSAYPWASPLRGQRKRCSKRLAVLSGNSKYLGYIPNVIIAMGCRIKPNGARGLSPPSNRALPRDRSALAWTVSPSMRCALTAVAGAAARAGSTFSPRMTTAARNPTSPNSALPAKCAFRIPCSATAASGRCCPSSTLTIHACCTRAIPAPCSPRAKSTAWKLTPVISPTSSAKATTAITAA